MTPKNRTDDDAMPQGMADEALASTDEEWEDVRTGIGRNWDLAKDGPLTAIFTGPTEVDLPEESRPKDRPDKTTAVAYQFALADGSGELVFLWESHELRAALDEIGQGEKVKITSLGEESFNSKDGPRRVKRFRVQRAKSA